MRLLFMAIQRSSNTMLFLKHDEQPLLVGV
jgi:hypothetical protein